LPVITCWIAVMPTTCWLDSLPRCDSCGDLDVSPVIVRFRPDRCDARTLSCNPFPARLTHKLGYMC
jgi:hypothetical protein